MQLRASRPFSLLAVLDGFEDRHDEHSHQLSDEHEDKKAYHLFDPLCVGLAVKTVISSQLHYTPRSKHVNGERKKFLESLPGPGEGAQPAQMQASGSSIDRTWNARLWDLMFFTGAAQVAGGVVEQIGAWRHTTLGVVLVHGVEGIEPERHVRVVAGP